jgi:hypothetical protein
MYKALSVHKIRQNTKMPTFYKTPYLILKVVRLGVAAFYSLCFEINS